MRSTCVCSRWALGVMAVALFGMSVSVYGEQFDLRPKSSTGAFTVIGTDTIEIPAGGVEVTLEIIAYGWSAAPGAPTLGAFQATINGTQGYPGANAVPSNPGADLTPKGGVNVNDGTGAFQTTKACNLSLLDCSVNAGVCVGAGNFCLDNPRFVLTPCTPLAAVATVTLDFEYGAASQSTTCGGVVDPGAAGANALGYCGTLVLNVPGTAIGTYTIDFVQDVNKTFMNDFTAALIPGLFTVPGKIKIVTGRCCSSIGQVSPPNCEDNLTQAQCNSRPSGRNWQKDGLCPPAGPACPSCQTNADCEDPICVGGANSGAACPNGVSDCQGGTCLADNKCTSNVCQPDNTCLNEPLFNSATNCCDPADASLTLIDDNDACTADACDAGTGNVAHTPTTGNACDDTFDCTVNDTCDAGTCTGTDVNTIPCQDDADCPLGTCGTAVAGFCECSENTPLCLEVQGKFCSISQAACQSDADCGTSGGTCVRLYDDPNCFDGGETMTVAIHIGAGSQQVTGGQFLINYDPSCLDFVSIGPCAGDTIFTNVIQTD
ncbi:MAG: hypothetical protein HY763_12750, partial [Planctomycetes bacterium]|nr:hypothetical protein [Planctomycetota bacterium]